MKKSGSILFILGLCVCLIIGGSIGAAASQFFTIEVSPINVKANGEEFKPLAADGEPLQLFAYEGVTYVPLRAFAELYGLQVGYDAASNSALVSSAEYKEIADAELSIRQELPLHSFGVMEPCRIYYLDAATLLLCYYYSIPGAAPESLLVRYDLTNGTATELFRGELSDSYFYDVSIYQYGRNHYIQDASANKNILHYDAEAKKLNIIDAAEANRFTVLLENGKYLVCRDGKLFLTEEVEKQGEDIYEIDRDIIAYDIAPRGTAFAGLDYSGAITTVDFETGKVSTIIPDSLPEGLVGYNDHALHYSHYAADEEYFIIDALCENGNVIQVVDMAGKVIAEYASQGRECRLLQICDDKLLIADGEKMQGYIVAWDYESDTTEILFDSSEQYTKPVYISDAKLYASGETLSVFILNQGEAELLQIALKLNEQTLFGKAAAFLNKEFHNAYDPYYDIQGLTISNWQENGDEATFFLKMSYLYHGVKEYISQAEKYFDYFRMNNQIVTLLDDSKANGFSDDDMAVFAASSLKNPDFRNGNTKEEYDEITEKYFGKKISDFNNSKTYVDPESGLIKPTGWSYNSTAFMSLKSLTVNEDNTITADFYVLNVSDAIAMDLQKTADEIKDDMLNKRFVDYNTKVSVIRLDFEEKQDANGNMYIKYLALDIIEDEISEEEYNKLQYEQYAYDRLGLKEANYEFKVVLKGEYGEFIELYSNDSPIGTEWQPVKISDFILK